MEAVLECPSCGHHLSMYHAPEPTKGEDVATRVAARVATWWFPTAILVAVGIWAVVNVVARPFEPYPVVVLAWISAVLATIAALQGPLILLTQRRSAMRDRQRDEEGFRVAVNTEADLHRLSVSVGALAGKVESLLVATSEEDRPGS